MIYYRFKRLFDLTFSIILLLLLGGFLILIMFVIWLNIGSPVFFRQVRIGLNEKPFFILKFRTMKIFGDGISDQMRLTKLGSVLRKYSIDEFPQLFYILKGEMSFIGPRPLLKEYLPYYNCREKLRHQVRPGMTGLAQVNGRSFVSWDYQFELDAQYVENISFKLDLIIFLKTIPLVLSSKDMMVVGRIDQIRFDVHRQRNQ